MKIFLAFFQSKEKYKIPGYSFWEIYIKNGLKEYGYEVIENDEIDWAYGYAIKDPELNAKWKEITWSKTVKYLQNAKVDLFLSYFYPEQVDVNAIKYISQNMGIPVINFFCDNLRDFKKIPNEFKYFTCNWVPEFNATKMYENQNLKYVHAPMPMWVSHKYRNVIRKENINISFIGSSDLIRKKYLNHIKRSSVEIERRLTIYGAGWRENNTILRDRVQHQKTIQNQFEFLMKNGLLSFINKFQYAFINKSEPNIMGNGLLSDSDYFKITRESLVTLGINSIVDQNHSIRRPLLYSRLRDIEAPMLGACYLTEMTSDIEKFYSVNEEILVYRNLDELVEICGDLVNNHSLRNKIRVNGQKKALNELNIGKSLSKILNQVF